MVKYLARNVERRKDAKKAHWQPLQPKKELRIIFGEGFEEDCAIIGWKREIALYLGRPISFAGCEETLRQIIQNEIQGRSSMLGYR